MVTYWCQAPIKCSSPMWLLDSLCCTILEGVQVRSTSKPKHQWWGTMQLAYLWSLCHNHTNQCMNTTSQHTITPMQFSAFFIKTGWGDAGGTVLKRKTRGKHRPAIGIWPDQGELQPYVWCHSSESHQSHTRRNTSVSQTHNCLPLRKHSGQFNNMPFKCISGWGWCWW